MNTLKNLRYLPIIFTIASIFTVTSAFSQNSEMPPDDQIIFVAPNLSQGTDFQVITFVASQGNGDSFVKILHDKSYYYRALVLPSTSMQMNGSVVDQNKLDSITGEHPDKAGLLNRPTLIVGGEPLTSDNIPSIKFMELRLPYVVWQDKQKTESEIYVKAKIVGGKNETGGQSNDTRRKDEKYVPLGLGNQLPQNLPNSETSLVVDFEIYPGFQSELTSAINNGGTITFSAYEIIYKEIVQFDDIVGEPYTNRVASQGDKLYDVTYTFADDPHNAADKNLKLIIGNSVNALKRGEGHIAGFMQSYSDE